MPLDLDEKNRVLADSDFDLETPEQESFMTLEQYYWAMQSDPFIQPGKWLMFAILEDAVTSLTSNYPGVSKKQRRLLAEDEEWIWSDDADWPFSCVNICQVLGIDIGYMRDSLLQWSSQVVVRLLPPANKHQASDPLTRLVSRTMRRAA